MTETAKKIKAEIDKVMGGYVTLSQRDSLWYILSLVEELDKDYESLRTAVEPNPMQANEIFLHDPKSGVVVGRRDEAARELGLHYGIIE